MPTELSQFSVSIAILKLPPAGWLSLPPVASMV